MAHAYAVIKFTGDHTYSGPWIQETDEAGNFVAILDLDGEKLNVTDLYLEWEIVREFGPLQNAAEFFQTFQSDDYMFHWRGDSEVITELPTSGSLWKAWELCARHDIKCQLQDEVGLSMGSVNKKGYYRG